MECQQWEIAQLLIEYGADTLSRDSDLKSAIDYLPSDSKKKIPNLHKRVHNPVHYLELRKAVVANNTMRALRLLTHYHGDCDAVDPEDSKRLTLLSIAASNGNIHLARALIKKGADPNKEGANRETPLTIAKRDKNKDLLRTLTTNDNSNHPITSTSNLVKMASSDRRKLHKASSQRTR